MVENEIFNKIMEVRDGVTLKDIWETEALWSAIKEAAPEPQIALSVLYKIGEKERKIQKTSA